MIQLTPIAIAATSQQYLTNVVENLCQAFCADNGVQPTGIVNFTVAEQQTVNTQTIVTINAAVLVAYTPKGSCRSVTKQWVEQFKVAFIGAAGAVPTISLTPLVTQVTPGKCEMLQSRLWRKPCYSADYFRYLSRLTNLYR